MTGELNMVHLILNASVVVQLVMGLLVSISIFSWVFIIERVQTYRICKKVAKTFEERFWSGIELGKLYNEINVAQTGAKGLSLIFQAGYKEFVRQRTNQTTSPEAIMEATQRAMRVAQSREIESLEHHLSFLATAGSVTPYVGLFGTVWGIMNSFIALGGVKQATLAMVAPGIAEALIATAMGLFAAIPAVIAYNRFSHHVERLEGTYDNFVEEFTAILHRKAYSGSKKAS
jgi:biopolymer transport protein TolQ